MSTILYKRLWREQLERRLPDLKEILSWNDLFEEWHLDSMPEHTAAEELYLGLDLFYGQVEPKMAVQYIKRSVEVADRAFAEDKFRKGRMCMESFPSNRGLAERVRQYARALLGKKIDFRALCAGAEDIISYFKKWDDPIDSQMHAFWLAAVRMTLIAGEPSRAQSMIREAPSLKWHQKEADLLADVAQAAIEAQPIKDRKLLERFDKLFDKVRSPKWRGSAKVFSEPNEQRLELGLIRYRYFTSKDGSINWEEVIESIRS